MTDDQKRLTLNVGPATHATLQRLLEREGGTLTDAVGRLVRYGDLAYEATQVAGDELLIRRGDAVERVRFV